MDDTTRELRAQMKKGEYPCGAARLAAFPARMRATVLPEGDQRAGLHQLDGYASMVDKPYEMWDIFGPYREEVAANAFEATLAANPDVAYLVNHKGVTMARTTNGTLELEADALGLRTRAFVNPKRTDVRDLVVAIEDKNVTEMSFAFMIEDAEWTDDFEKFRILRVNLDRGDVSAVNYGANPYTSVAARSREILQDLNELPTGAAREAVARLAARSDMAAPPHVGGRSTALISQMLIAEEM